MEILGYILAIFVGLSTGLIGAGGSILAMPILVYLFGVEAGETAPAYSLFVVGVSSMVGAYIKNKEGLINYKLVLSFGLPTIVAIFITRYFIVPALPDELFSVGNLLVSKHLFVMVLFSLLMIIASVFMIREKEVKETSKINPLLNMGSGLSTGVLSGLVGAGGGFIIVPALMKIGKLNVKAAIATSMAIIAINTSVGFVSSMSHVEMDWKLLLIFSSLSVVGILVGHFFSKKIKAKNLKKGFGWFILLTGLFILTKELYN